MRTTDVSEKGLESLIVESLVSQAGYIQGSSTDFEPDHSVDLAQLVAFLQATQPKVVEQLRLTEDGPSRRSFLDRLQGEITKRGIIDVLRKGVKHHPVVRTIDLFYGTPTPGNAKAAELFAEDIFSVTRQLRYSNDETQLSLDLCIFINGLPVATFELKNNLTKQTVHDAMLQYMRDRDPRELLFQFKRCMVHFAVDDQEVRMCTQLKGKASWFLPFNKGWNDGASNPPNPKGIKTDYLWKEVLTKQSLTDIIENYAQVIETKDPVTGRKKFEQIFPRYHQLDVTRKLLATVATDGPGRRYLIQHSAGSGKSNSIAWLAHQLIGVQKDGKTVFDSIIVVTDRRLLDWQIQQTIKHFAQVSATVGAVTEGAKQLRKFIQDGKKIIISTVQKFPFVLDELGSQHRNRHFAIIIDEAHSSQGGRTTAKMHMALGETDIDEDVDTVEDKINQLIESRKMLNNASYFAFTATPKHKTLEIFGIPYQEGEDTKHRPFHSYTMKQAIDEGFILDVLKNYTPVETYYHLIKSITDDPEFDTKKAQNKLRRYVESHPHPIRQKTEVMVDHFHDSILARHVIGGQARAMLVTGGVARAIQYYHAFVDYLKERHSPYKALVAFSGEHEYNGKKVTEASLNGVSTNKTAETFKSDPYRFLICADKFQTGYDEPLLHTMYVDKILSGIKAVQTLSRLNRAHPKKSDTFVMDFANDPEVIQMSFQPYYRTTILSRETDPNKLHDLNAALDGHQVYNQAQIDQLVDRFLTGAPRETLDPLLDESVALYKEKLTADQQIDFKGKAKAFVRTYGFLASILPYKSPEWEKLSIYLNFLIPKLPAPEEPDLAKGILETIDLESYRNEMQATMSIAMADQDSEVYPIPTSGGGKKPEPEMDFLSNIIKEFNDLFGKIDWKDKDKIMRVITEDIPAMVESDRAYQNARANSDRDAAKFEHDMALKRAMMSILSDHTELFKQYSDNMSFRRWLQDRIFAVTYEKKKRKLGDS